MSRSNGEKGQTLVVVFILMVLALTVGIGVSTRFIKSTRTIKQTDFSTRATAIAEAGVERILLRSFETLSDYILNGNCNNDCILEITGSDGLVARAEITLSHLGATSEPFALELTTTGVREVSLLGYANDAPVSVCWNDPLSGDLPSVVGLFFYGTDGDYHVDSYAYNSLGSPNSSNGFSEATPSMGYQHCFSVTGNTTPRMLRLKSVYNDTQVFIVPDVSEELPSQGILIESVGTVNNVTKTVRVLKSGYYLPAQFDYVLYSKSETDLLANY